MQIEVLGRPPEAATFEGNGTVRHYFKQWATLTVDGLPTSFEFSTDEVLPAGPAVLDPRSFSVVNGRLQVTRPRLVSLVGAATAVKPSSAAKVA
ncbi:hypothetical protein [Dyella psychrodurans]|nr:hypothetical protein [Dyella psychrodurans]